jgi:hypothetical protein
MIQLFANDSERILERYQLHIKRVNVLNKM